MAIKASGIISVRVWTTVTELTKMAANSSNSVDRDIHLQFIGSFFDIKHPCYGQLHPYQTFG